MKRTELEKRLEQYRTEKRREAYLRKAKDTITGLFVRLPQQPRTTKMTIQEEEAENLIIEEVSETSTPLLSDDETTEELIHQNSLLDVVTYALYFVLWVTLFIIFIELQFGLVFLVSSALVGICLNTRTAPKRKNEVSAYSVFNRNCERIDGTLDAEQFEREIRYGPAALH